MAILKPVNRVCVSAVGSVCGKKEYDGAFGDRYDEYSEDDTFGQKTFEQAEEEMQRRCFAHTLRKGGFAPSDIDAVFAGDNAFCADFDIRGMKCVFLKNARGRVRSDKRRENHTQIQHDQHGDRAKGERTGFQVEEKTFHKMRLLL